MTEQRVTTEDAIREDEPRSYWELVGSSPREEIVYVDEEGKVRFPDTPAYVYPSPEQARRARRSSGKRIYANEALAATEAAVRKAEEMDVDITQAEGTGAGGQVKVEDVEAHASAIENVQNRPPLEADEDEEAFWQLADDTVIYHEAAGSRDRATRGTMPRPTRSWDDSTLANGSTRRRRHESPSGGRGVLRFVAAVVALVTTFLGALLQGVVVDWWTVLPPGLVVIVMFLVGYFVSRAKELTASLAGAVLVVIQFVVSARRGEVVDMAFVSTALTYIFNVTFVYLLPRVQPRETIPRIH